jgi:hypothetical protein
MNARAHSSVTYRRVLLVCDEDPHHCCSEGLPVLTQLLEAALPLTVNLLMTPSPPNRFGG